MGVIPRVSPTVAIALAVSKLVVSKGKFSCRLINIPERTHKQMYIKAIVVAFRMTSPGIVLPKASVRELFLKIATEVKNRTVIVVIFMPPPVLPGAAPTSISRVCKNIPLSENLLKSTVLKPAVLGVTAVKKEARIRLSMGISPNSTKK